MKKTIIAIIFGVLMIGTLGAIVVSAVDENNTTANNTVVGAVTANNTTDTINNLCAKCINSATNESIVQTSTNKKCCISCSSSS
jgi:hypothetical protein